MKFDEGRLQTAEHILAKVIENEIGDAKVVIAKFREESGLLEVMTQHNLRELDLGEIQNSVNEVIKRKLMVFKSVKSRKEVENEFDLSKIPKSVQEIRIVEIGGFDRRPCRDPHVDNTDEIGTFEIISLKRVGNNRYRFTFKVS
ncbi:MAG: alanyl-tRNA editing protein [Candidatus Methanofastidiosia archaeon]